jgi:Zn-dependent protease
MDIMEIGAKIGVYYIPFLFALCFHEYAHGIVAKMRGDNTAQMMGRLTMNPVSHIDILGTVILPLAAILFAAPVFLGWAKPVPVNARNLKHPRKDMFWVALAGPMSNVLLALVGALLIGVLIRFASSPDILNPGVTILSVFIKTNLALAIFNMIPLNPLDGGKVLARFLSAKMNYKLEQYEQISGMILMALFFFGYLNFIAIPINWGFNLLMHGVGIGV